jgi:hypothetical protein
MKCGKKNKQTTMYDLGMLELQAVQHSAMPHDLPNGLYYTEHFWFCSCHN